MTPADDNRPTWDLYRRMADSPLLNPARRQATLWALEQLEQRMGSDWPERYWEAAGHVPAEVNLGGAHTGALGSLLELALRLHLLTGIPGIEGVQKEMRNDLRDDRRRHSTLQLEVAGLALRSGFTVALEHRPSRHEPPIDVLMRSEHTALRVETFAIILDQRSQEGRAHWDGLSQAIMSIHWKFDVEIAGDLGGRMSEDDATELLRLLESAAQAVVETGTEAPVVLKDARLRVLPAGTPLRT